MAIEQERLLALIEYAQKSAAMSSKPTSNVTSHFFCRHENGIAKLPGIHLNISAEDSGDEIWLVVNRLHEQKPPDVTSIVLQAWIELTNNPSNEPVLKTHIEIQKLVELGLMPSPSLNKETIELSDAKDIIFLDAYELRVDVKTQLDIYIKNRWLPWSIEEKVRRESISLYKTLFTLKQQLEGSIIESQLELVWGTGIVVWKMGDISVSYPLVTRLVEISFNEMTMDIEIRPRDVDARLELEIYSAVDNQGVTDLERIGKEYFSRANQTFSPFDSTTFDFLLNSAVTYLDSQGVYWPNEISSEDRSLPKPEVGLKMTDTWVIFARPRSTSVYIQDLERLKERIAEENIILPEAIASIVTNPLNEHIDIELPSFRGLSNVDGSGAEGSQGTSASADLFFPKAYNEEQVRIIQMLERSPGVIVQGPPGTGKTHTISNIICHSLALGKRVLVTSMRDPALGVLREHLPEDIRPLAISLLSSEQEGMKQFEFAVAKIAAEVQRIDRVSLGREISQLETHIDGLHGRIANLDRSITKLAVSNLSKLVIDEEAIDPQEAAKELVREHGNFDWIEDELTIEPKHSPRFTESHVAALRDARRKLGIDIDYLGKKLPEASAFPDSRDLLRVHQDLSQLSKLKAAIDEGSVPPLADSSKETFQLAASLSELISNIKPLKNQLRQSGHDWFNTLRTKLKNGHSKDMFQMFEALAEEIDLAVEIRRRFLEKPVEAPHDIDQNHELVQALHNLAGGKSPFGLVGMLGKSDQKKKLQAIRLLSVTPNGSGDWAHILEYVKYIKHLRALVTRWNVLSSEVFITNLPTNEPIHFQLAVEALEIFRSTRNLVAVERVLDEKAKIVLPSWNHGSETTNNEELLQSLESILTHHLTRNRLAETWALKERFQEITAGCNGRIVDSINKFCAETLGNRQVADSQMQAEWTSLIEELRRLYGLASYFKTVENTCSLIRDSGAPKWALKLEVSPVTQTVDELLPGEWASAWRLRRLSTYLESIDVRKDLKNLSVLRSEAEADLARAYQDVVSKRTWHKLASNATPTVRQALAAFSNAISKIGKGTGKRAVRYRQDARLAAAQANSAIPCWIMPHYRVSESLPPELGVFDLVIIDEASQSDLTALPAILRAKKVLIVGDDKQVSPEGVGIEEEKIRNLMTRFLGGQVDTFRAQMTPERSIYDLCKVVFAEYSVMLKEHFRCVSPIIEYSKREFYNNELKPLRLPKASERLDPPLVDVFVEDGFTHKTDNTNHAEARFIVNEILAICADPMMDKRSIGVVSLLGEKQALKIWHMLEDELGPELIEKFKIACGDARTFQGKERDIMFLSMVVAPNTTITALSRDTFAQRFNVAASRARDRMYLVRSAGLENLSDKDKLRRGLITHFVHPFAQDEQRVEDLRELCESPFEREVYDELTHRGYRVIPQVKVGDYRIDMVVEGHHDARLAVECDGDRYHGPDKWDADMNRQRILERAGWRFWRCFASTFVMHKGDVLKDLVNTLSERGIEPIGAENAPRSVYTEFRTYSVSETQAQQFKAENELDDEYESPEILLQRDKGSSNLSDQFSSQSQTDHISNNTDSINFTEKSAVNLEVPQVHDEKPIEYIEPLFVQVGDHVTYIDQTTPDLKNHVQIVSGQDNFDAGIINENRPLAQTLLDMAEGDEVELSVPGRPIHRLKILQIVKQRKM